MFTIRRAVAASWFIPNALQSTRAMTTSGPVQREIERKLTEIFQPIKHCEVINESSGHNVPIGSETHFKVVLVSPLFDGVRLVEPVHVPLSIKPAILQSLFLCVRVFFTCTKHFIHAC